MGYTAVRNLNVLDAAERNIIIGCHLLDVDVPLNPKTTIILNTEQIIHNTEQIYSPNRIRWNANICARVQNCETWDFSTRNIAAFGDMGIGGVKQLKIGHQPELTRIKKAAEQDIDVLFYGSISPRRQEILDQLDARGLKVVCLFGDYGMTRDRYIARSKIVLNLHNHAAEIFEVVRVHYLLSNSVAVVSEVNTSTSIPEMFVNAVSGVPYEALVDECVRLVRDKAAREELQERGYHTISQYPQAEFTKDLLTPRPHPYP